MAESRLLTVAEKVCSTERQHGVLQLEIDIPSLTGLASAQLALSYSPGRNICGSPDFGFGRSKK